MSNLTKIRKSDLPRSKEKIHFSESGNNFLIKIGQDGATANMQDNNAAFASVICHPLFDTVAKLT